MKQPYVKPVVTRIVLNYQQAVLAACSGSAMNVRAGTRAYCRSTCRRGALRSSDSSASS